MQSHWVDGHITFLTENYVHLPNGSAVVAQSHTETVAYLGGWGTGGCASAPCSHLGFRAFYLPKLFHNKHDVTSHIHTVPRLNPL